MPAWEQLAAIVGEIVESRWQCQGRLMGSSKVPCTEMGPTGARRCRSSWARSLGYSLLRRRCLALRDVPHGSLNDFAKAAEVC